MIGAVNRLGVEVRRGLSQFAVGSKEPSLGFDFIDNTYLADGTKNLSQALTHSRSGNATMTDGYGPELVTNGDFSTDLSGWTENTSGIVTWSDGVALVGDGNTTVNTYFSQAIPSVSGKTYEIKVGINGLSGSGVRVYLDNVSQTGGTYFTSDQTFYHTATASTIDVEIYRFRTHVGQTEIDNVSVREMPVIKWAPHNLLTYSEDFSNAAWVKANATVTANAATAPDGTETADKIVFDGTASAQVRQSIGGLTSSAPYTLSMWIKADSPTTVLLGVSSYEAKSVTTEWQLISITQIAGGAGRNPQIAENGEVIPVYVWGAHVYRSDLGGMVDNPERGDSYVPTAARPFGPELVTNGTFDSDSDWIKGTGWSISGGKASGSSAATLSQSASTTTGKAYLFKFTISDYLAGTLTPNISGISGPSFSSNGTFEVVIFAGGGSAINLLGGGFTGSVDNVSVKEAVNPSVARYLPRVGHHVYNGDAWVNEGLLHESEARTNLITDGVDPATPWLTSNSTKTSGETAPDGSDTAVTVANTATAASQINVQNITVSSGASTFSIFAKAGLVDFCTLRTSNFDATANGYTSFDLSNGTIFSEDVNHTASIEAYGNGWYRVAITFSTSTDLTGNIHAYLNADGGSVFDADLGANGASSLILWGGQLEAGSTPSSYIPTAGATVTRAAETLTVPAANLPWPYPEVIGDELVTNGTFDTDTTGWSAANAAILSVNAGRLRVTNNVTDYGLAYQGLSTDVGGVYKLVLTSYGGTASARPRLGTTIGDNNLWQGPTVAGEETSEVIFVAQSTTTYVSLYAQSTGDTDYSEYDNISVREINPLSVSIQMDGRMTYADEGSPVDKTLFYWYESNNANIRLYLDTSSTKTGGAYWIQDDGGARVDFYSAGNVYSPGLNVPYNIASRHGSNFTNGAVDGVALIADTSATGFPALSATDLELGYDYMGTIGTFRVWDQDLGDDGIVTATAPSLEPSLSLTFDGSGLSFTVLDWSE